jgi:hypothetical protein
VEREVAACLSRMASHRRVVRCGWMLRHKQGNGGRRCEWGDGEGGGLSTRQVNKKERGLPSGRQDA